MGVFPIPDLQRSRHPVAPSTLLRGPSGARTERSGIGALLPPPGQATFAPKPTLMITLTNDEVGSNADLTFRHSDQRSARRAEKGWRWLISNALP
jgi:hypothetical protein